MTADTARDAEITDCRQDLDESIQVAVVAVNDARKTRAKLASDYLYDVEHAENLNSALAERFLAQAEDALRAAAAIVTGIHR
jgi:predicted RNase H-related nuclease YkuK (DUF458 family)